MQKYGYGIMFFAAAVLISGIPYSIYHHQKKLSSSYSNNTSSSFKTNPIKPSTEGLTVFIHGTTGSSLNFCDPLNCLTKSACLEDDETSQKKPRKNRAEKIVDSYRNHPAMRYDQMLDAEGLVVWEKQKASDKEAASYLIPAYKTLAKLTKISAQHETYALFGWSGLLTQKARKDTGYKLYHALINYQHEQHLNGKKDARIRLVTHSHGGNVALWLAEAEATYKKGLKIETLVMLGAPIQGETAEYIANSLFESIILCYSTGDSVQRSDCISTHAHKSFARMQDLIDLEDLKIKKPLLRRYDILVGINNNATQVTHINMWLSGRSLKLAPVFGPLPLVVTTPLIIDAINNNQLPPSSKLSIDIEKGALELNFYSNPFIKKMPHTISWKTKDLLITYDQLAKKSYKAIAYWGTRMNDEWRSYDKSRNIFWNKKNLDILTSLLW